MVLSREKPAWKKSLRSHLGWLLAGLLLPACLAHLWVENQPAETQGGPAGMLVMEEWACPHVSWELSLLWDLAWDSRAGRQAFWEYVA